MCLAVENPEQLLGPPGGLGLIFPGEKRALPGVLIPEMSHAGICSQPGEAAVGEEIGPAARGQGTVLLEGESAVGEELICRDGAAPIPFYFTGLHRNPSLRDRDSTLVQQNAGGGQDGLVERAGEDMNAASGTQNRL